LDLDSSQSARVYAGASASNRSSLPEEGCADRAGLRVTITYFGHVARFEGMEELIAGLDKEASRHATRSDHSAKRLLALSRIIYDKYRYIRWGMGHFGVCVLLCSVTAIRASTT
jgi:hypothetical protein